MKYYCSKCKMAVIVVKDKEPIVACNCNAPIIGEMEASLKGGTVMEQKQ